VRDYGFLHGNARRKLLRVQWFLKVPFVVLVARRSSTSAVPLFALSRADADGWLRSAPAPVRMTRRQQDTPPLTLTEGFGG